MRSQSTNCTKTKQALLTLILLAVAGLFFSSIVINNAIAEAIPADTIQYTGKGTVTFNHGEHSKKMACTNCHKGETPTKITIENKKQGHKACLTCHKAEKKKGNKAAPTSCKLCHVK